jgi:hypothetical protein
MPVLPAVPPKVSYRPVILGAALREERAPLIEAVVAHRRGPIGFTTAIPARLHWWAEKAARELDIREAVIVDALPLSELDTEGYAAGMTLRAGRHDNHTAVIVLDSSILGEQVPAWWRQRRYPAARAAESVLVHELHHIAYPTWDHDDIHAATEVAMERGVWGWRPRGPFG